MTALAWQEDIADELVEHGVTVAAYVPDSRLEGILQRLDSRGVIMRSLGREEECIGYAAGVRVAGGRPAVLCQSSGIGNSINVLASLVRPYGVGLPLVVSMRGRLGEKNPSQVTLGRATAHLLDAVGVHTFAVDRPGDVRPVTAGVCDLAFHAAEPAAVLLEPRLGGSA